MSKFRNIILAALANVPEGYMQRIDGLRCEPNVIDHDFWFFRFRLRLMEKDGLIVSRKTGSYWPSCDGMPSFALTDKGRKLANEVDQSRKENS
jgi:hypothetical protein